MTDRELTDSVLEHVAVLAFLYYPGIEVDDPTYSLGDDIEWCVARLGKLSDAERGDMRALIGRAITDPTATREVRFTALCDFGTIELERHE